MQFMVLVSNDRCLLLRLVFLCLQKHIQVYPPLEGEQKVTRLQDRLMKKLGDNAHPFFFQVRNTPFAGCVSLPGLHTIATLCWCSNMGRKCYDTSYKSGYKYMYSVGLDWSSGKPTSFSQFANYGVSTKRSFRKIVQFVLSAIWNWML